MDSSVILRARKIRDNRLLFRKQMVIELHHYNIPTPSKQEIAERLAKMFKVDPQTAIIFNLRSSKCGCKGYALIYDSVNHLLKFDPKYRQRRIAIEHIYFQTSSQNMKKGLLGQKQRMHRIGLRLFKNRKRFYKGKPSQLECRRQLLSEMPY